MLKNCDHPPQHEGSLCRDAKLDAAKTRAWNGQETIQFREFVPGCVDRARDFMDSVFH